jgi:thiosulfate/3-mercaptopyruvate sulfurtransferase
LNLIAPVVDLAWWREHQHDVVLVDVRWYLDGRSGSAAYERGHLPGAIFVDLDRWLSGEASDAAGRHPLPDAEVFAAGMSQYGIGDDATVVAYDDDGGVIAARLVWMLRSVGHPAALLDGGLTAYPDGLVPGVVTRPAASFTPKPWPSERIADIDDATDTANVVLDARNSDRYQGDRDPVDPRAGHIPGAHNVSCRENVNPNGTFLPVTELRRRFQAAGVTDDAQVVAYCGSGVTACHNLLALEFAGFGPGRLFPGSWSAYSRAADRPVAVGHTPYGKQG